MVSSGKRPKRHGDSPSIIKNNVASGTRPSTISSIIEDLGNSNVINNDLTSLPRDGAKEHYCRFCNKRFEKSQALGGHMNKHRAEKEEEGLRKARSLVESKQQILFGNFPWTNYAGRGGGAGNQSYGQSLSSNAHIAGTSTTPQSYPGNPSASIQQNQNQMSQSTVLPQQQMQVHGHQVGGVNIIRGSHSRSLENVRTPSQPDGITVTGQHQAHHAEAWVNSGQMAYPGQHGGTTDFHVQHQVPQQAGPSQSLQDMTQSASGVPMASYAHQQQYLQDHSANAQFMEHAQIHQPGQYYYEVPHPNQYPQLYHFQAPQDGSQTSMDHKSESLRDQSVGTNNQTSEHHIPQEGTDHTNADPMGECGAPLPGDNVDEAHSLGFQ